MKVSIAVVAYNEEKTLPRLLQDLKAQDYPHENVEILLIDSVSDDGTWQIMNDFSQEDHGFSDVKLFQNPDRILPCGNNIALKNYTGDAIVRIDAHASVPSDFISKNVAVLESGENVCGGPRPNIIDGETPWKKMLLAAEGSMFGSSIASYRKSEKRRYVSSIFHGMYRRQVYDRAGLYNPLLVRTEDNDMSWRIRQCGYDICYDPSIVSYQHTRPSLRSMIRQKYLNGYWIGKTMGVNPHCFSLFHFVPGAFVLSLLLGMILAPFTWLPLAAIGCAYGAALLLFTVGDMVSGGFMPVKLLLPLVFMAMHVSYGIGTLWGLIQMPFWLKRVKKEINHG